MPPTARRSYTLLLAVLLASAGPCTAAGPPSDRRPRTLELQAKDTLTVVELRHGDELRFKLANGQVRSFFLQGTSAHLVEKVAGGIVYAFDCRLRADGQPITLRRFVCSQESFYEPWVINGVRIWVSSSARIFELVPPRYPEQHYRFDADTVLALQDATRPICPEPLRPWYPNDRQFIDVGTCYNGDDPWLGPYLGQACHIGLDVNMRKGTPLTAPIDFDDQWIFSADHRWRGVRRWPNGDVWALQSHHVDKLLVPQRTPLKAGTHYGEGAGKGIGSHQHSHFEFRLGPGVYNRGELGGIEVDPWIIFWQIFENQKASQNTIRAAMEPLAPARTGQAVRFAAAGWRAGPGSGPLRYYWAFGDGSWSDELAPEHVFSRPGVHPVTLVVDDGEGRTSCTQHVTVAGEPVRGPAFTVAAPDEVTFHPRPVGAADMYGWPVPFVPHTLRMAATPGGAPAAKHLVLRNLGGGVLPPAETPEVRHLRAATGWLTVTRAGEGNGQGLSVAASAKGLAAGRYEAVVEVRCPGAVNPRQAFRVELTVRESPSPDEVVVDDRGPGCYATPYGWVGHQFLRARQRGYAKRYLTNGGRPNAGVVRFTPDLGAGRYEVRFAPETPFGAATIPVRVRHAEGETRIRFLPSKSPARSLGIFPFAEGTDGFVEIAADGAEGLVVADAVVFRRIGP